MRHGLSQPLGSYSCPLSGSQVLYLAKGNYVHSFLFSFHVKKKKLSVQIHCEVKQLL